MTEDGEGNKLILLTIYYCVKQILYMLMQTSDITSALLSINSLAFMLLNMHGRQFPLGYP